MLKSYYSDGVMVYDLQVNIQACASGRFDGEKCVCRWAENMCAGNKDLHLMKYWKLIVCS